MLSCHSKSATEDDCEAPTSLAAIGAPKERPIAEQGKKYSVRCRNFSNRARKGNTLPAPVSRVTSRKFSTDVARDRTSLRLPSSRDDEKLKKQLPNKWRARTSEEVRTSHLFRYWRRRISWAFSRENLGKT